MKAIINARIYDYKSYIENGYVIYDNNILEIGEMKDFNGHYETYDAAGKLLLPGLLNGHTHLYSTLFRGCPLGASPDNFMDVLTEIWWHFDKKLTLESIKASAYHYAKESLRYGVTSIIDHHASGEIKDSLQTIRYMLNQEGVKHALCFESSDRFNLEASLMENIFALEHNGFIGLHASLSLNDSSLKRISELKGPIHVHVAESELDEKDSLDRFGLSVVERLNKFNLLRADSIMAHCVHINDYEAELIKKNNCFIAINPSSNLNNAVGLYRYDLIEKYKIPILIGTDGLGANVAKEWQNFYYVGKQVLNHPSGISLDTIKNYINSAYEYFNKKTFNAIGAIKEGYNSDFIIVDYHSMTPITDDNIFGHVFFGVYEACKPFAVFTNGVKRIDQYEHMEPEVDYSHTINQLWRSL